MVENVSAARHNNLQARLELILGTGSGTSGYGQGGNYGTSLSSFPVSNQEFSNNNIITAEAINALYTDMVRCRVHQVGTEPTEISQLVANLNIIAEETSFIVNDEGITIVDNDGNKKGILDFERLMSTIEAEKFLIHTGTTENGISSTRTTVWNGEIVHEFAVTFLDANHRRHYFNSGGEIRFTASNSGSITAKGRDWAQLLSTIGTVKFSYNNTLSTGDGTEYSVGNYSLSNVYKLAFRKVGGGYESGVYNGNIYEVYAKELDTKTIQFKVVLNDVAAFGPATPGGPATTIDENVDGTLASVVKVFRADTEFVTVPSPTFSNLRTL